MLSLVIEVTNICNRQCLHCLRNRADAPESLPLELADAILSQAQALKFKKIALTGGEVAAYPHLEGLVRMIAARDLSFNLVTNGLRFQERLLPLLSEGAVKKKLTGVCFSLDGARAETHDALRGPGSFKEVLNAASLCLLANIPLSLKSVITTFNRDELTELALLGASMGVQDHCFLYTYPTPASLRVGAIPSHGEQVRIINWIRGSLAPTVRTQVSVDGYFEDQIMFICYPAMGLLTVDHQGNLIFCCCLSHLNEGDGVPSRLGPELLCSLKEVSLKEGIKRHFSMVAGLMAARVDAADRLSGLAYNPCYWCAKQFGKLGWLKDFPDSPWAAGMLEG